MRWPVLLLVTACSSSNSATPDAAHNSDASPDSAKAIDAAIDAPLLGNACPNSATEVKRITSALSVYPYNNEAILVADFDHDSIQDIAVIDTQSNSSSMTMSLRVKLFLGTGTDFAAPVQSDMTFPYYGPEQIQVGDFNGDHLADILFSYTDSQSSSRTSYVYIAKQAATGNTFTMSSGIDVSACKSSSDERLFGLAVLDVDADGDDDVLATVSYGGLGAAPEGVSVMHGSSTGLGGASCVRSATNTNAGFPAEMITAERFRTGDFDGDGKTDLVGLYYDHMQLFHATGASTFEANSATATYDEYAHLAIDRLAGRSDRGLIATSSSSTNMNSSAVRFAIDTTTGIAAGVPIATLNEDGGGYDILRGYAEGDFNGDGYTDIIEVGNHDYSNTNSVPVTFGMACDRSAQWQVGIGTFPNGIYALHAIDFNGHTDALVHEGSDYDLVIYQLQ